MVEVGRDLEKDVRGNVFARVDEESLSRRFETKGTLTIDTLYCIYDFSILK